MEEKDQRKLTNVITFAPDVWGEVRKFIRFYYTTYKFTEYVNSSLLGVDGHFHKYSILMGLAKRLVPDLKKDNEELIQRGYTEAIHSKELAAIIDTLFCELYSSVDCTRTVIGAIYGKYRNVPTKSTSKMFKNAAEQKMDERVPQEIRKAFEDGQSDWFPKLKKIRDSLNHSNIGSCSENEGKISYYHSLLGKEKGNVLLTDDVFKELSDYEIKVNGFLGLIFHSLNQTLKDEEIVQICGVFNSRFYQRFVSPREALNFHSGRCKSCEWFEKEDQPTCPFVDTCGAYKNRKLEKFNPLES